MMTDPRRGPWGILAGSAGEPGLRVPRGCFGGSWDATGVPEHASGMPWDAPWIPGDVPSVAVGVLEIPGMPNGSLAPSASPVIPEHPQGASRHPWASPGHQGDFWCIPQDPRDCQGFLGGSCGIPRGCQGMLRACDIERRVSSVSIYIIM